MAEGLVMEAPIMAEMGGAWNPSTWFAPTTTQEVVMVSGLPAAGKTQWARNYVDTQNADPLQHHAIRVSKDDYAAMLGVDEATGMVNALFRHAVQMALRAGLNVVCDDLNLDQEERVDLEHIVAMHNQNMLDSSSYVRKVNFRVVSMTDIALQELIRRDLARTPSVGPDKIKAMWRKYHQPEYHVNPDQPPALVVVLDGLLTPDGDGYATMALPLVALVNRYGGPYIPPEHQYRVIWISSLGEEHRPAINAWLEAHGLPCEMLLLATPALETIIPPHQVDQVMFAWNSYVQHSFATMAVIDVTNSLRWTANAVLTLQPE